MANKCSDYSVKGCPASYYLTCKAYKEGKNCWEVKSVPCCTRGTLVECKECEVYRIGRSQEAER